MLCLIFTANVGQAAGSGPAGGPAGNEGTTVNTPTGHAKPRGGAPFLARAPPALQAISASAVCFLIITQWRMLPRLATAG